MQVMSSAIRLAAIPFGPRDVRILPFVTLARVLVRSLTQGAGPICRLPAHSCQTRPPPHAYPPPCHHIVRVRGNRRVDCEPVAVTEFDKVPSRDAPCRDTPLRW